MSYAAFLIFFEGARCIGNSRHTAIPHRNRGDDDLLGVGIDNKIWIMRDKNHLPSSFCRPKVSREQLIDGFIIKVVIWLIDDKRPPVLHIHAKIED